MKTTFIITEKKRISEQIARALAPSGSFGDRGYSEIEHSDIISLRTSSEKNKSKNKKGGYIPCQVLRQGLKEKNYFYFCSNSCNSCMFLAQHLDNMGVHNARSIRKKYRYINENLISDFEHIILNVLRKSRGDQKYLVEEIESGDYPQKRSLDSEKNNLDDIIFKTCKKLLNHNKIVQNSNGFAITKKGRDSNRFKEYVTTEDITYYEFNRGSSHIIIADTYGTPYGFSRKFGKKDLQEAITSCNNWKDFEKLVKYYPNRQSWDPRDLKSHYARTRLFNSILSRRKSPDGSNLELDKVIAATDLDIAGSYIFLSTIEAANQFVDGEIRAGRKRLQKVEPEILKRMTLTNLEPEKLVEEFEKLLDFDWHNAYSGKVRSFFDYMYGSTITGQFNKKKRIIQKEKRKIKGIKTKKNKNVPFGIGRVQFLSLKKIIEEENKIRNSKPENFIYLVFNNLLDKKTIEQNIKKGEYSLLQVISKKTSLSYPKFIEVLEKDKVGTHTTRYKQIGNIERKQLIKTIDNKIYSTPYGNLYYNYLSKILDSTFKISGWNNLLQTTMEDWSANEIPKKQIEKEYDYFMNHFFKSFEKYIGNLSNKYKQIVTDLLKAYHSSPKMTLKKIVEKKEINVPEGAFLLEGDSVISKDDISNLFNKKTNLPKSHRGISSIYRHNEPTPLSIEDPIRRVCCIDRGYEFAIIKAKDVIKIPGLANENYTVFKAQINHQEDAISKFIKSGYKMKSYLEMELEEGEIGLPEEDAHDPLRLTNVVPSDIAGSDGIKLAQEYHKPWIATMDKIRKQEQGLINVQSFQLGDFNFERVERYEFGLVHNFESLLSAMLDKYNMPFWKTAKLAEELYLNTGD